MIFLRHLYIFFFFFFVVVDFWYILGQNTILVLKFWSYNQFGLYILVAVNLVHVIFNL